MDKNNPIRDEKETSRIEAFSDGVFAIAITLLVLDVKVPHIAPENGLFYALMGMWPELMAYFISFVTILIMWVSHHRLFTYIRRSNDTFLFLNGLLLMCVTFVPFPTALLSEYIRSPHATTAMAVYSGVYLFVTIVFNMLWQYASRGKRLLDKHANQCFVDNISKQYMFGPLLYLMAFVMAFINVRASVVMCFALALFFAFTGSISRFLPCEIRPEQD